MVNNPNVPDTDVLLIVKDIERGIKVNIEYNERKKNLNYDVF